MEWYEGCHGNWDGPYLSGVNITKNNVWDEEGNYIIRVKAKDVYGAESDWATLEITMPKRRTLLNDRFLLSFPFIQKLFTIFFIKITF